MKVPPWIQNKQAKVRHSEESEGQRVHFQNVTFKMGEKGLAYIQQTVPPT